MRMQLSLLVPVLTVAKVLARGAPSVSKEYISGNTTTGPSTVQFTSLSSGFDAPKVHELNNTAFDWWYFDAVASDLSASAVIVIFTAQQSGLWPDLPNLGTATWVSGLFTFPNATAADIFLPAESLTVLTVDDGSSGTLGGLNAGWAGTPDMSAYVFSVDEPDAGLQGSIALASTAPAHFPCSAAIDVPGQPLTLSPEFGWANAVPDANAKVDFIIKGSKLQFSGPGYHDKNWGSKPVDVTIKSWYWGHARVGPYSIVWFDDIAPDNSEHVSSYVSRDGKVITAACSGITVRPTGVNATYPPTPETALPDGFHIELNVEGEGELTLEVTNTRLITNEPGTAHRWIGSVAGGFNNKSTWEGVALYEAFTFDI